MTMNELTELFGWMSVLSIGVLMFSTIMILVIKGPAMKIHSKMFGLDEKELNAAYFQYLAQFKIAAIIFNLVPYVALKIIG
jgi:hypothetical protein